MIDQDKVKKKSQKNRKKGFCYYFCLMMEESLTGFVPVTNGSGSRRPKILTDPDS